MKPPVEAPTSRATASCTRQSNAARPACQFLAAAADVGARRAQQPHVRLGVHARPALRQALAVHGDLAGQDERLRLRSARRQPALPDQNIESFPFGGHALDAQTLRFTMKRASCRNRSAPVAKVAERCEGLVQQRRGAVARGFDAK